MPNIKSAKKRVVVTEKKNTQNKMIKTSVKTAIKKFNAALAAGDAEAAEKLLPETVSRGGGERLRSRRGVCPVSARPGGEQFRGDHLHRRFHGSG